LGTFIKVYEANRGSAISSAIEASPVALAVQALVNEGGSFQGTATDLLNQLLNHADAQASNHRGWPDSGWKLSRILRRLAPNLRASGFDVIFGDRESDHKRSRIIKIEAAASNASDVSDTSENRQKDADALGHFEEFFGRAIREKPNPKRSCSLLIGRTGRTGRSDTHFDGSR